MLARTKVICTIGPSVSNYESICDLIDAGMSVARLNFSHGSYDEHLERIELLKKARKEKDVSLAIMLDTRGPEIRLGKLPGDELDLVANAIYSVCPEGSGKGDIPINPKIAVDSLKVGKIFLIDDGYIHAEVVGKKEGCVDIKVYNSGKIRSNKGVNLPGTKVDLPAMTKKDIEDIKFGAIHDIDLVAASFIRSAEHVVEIKRLLKKEGKPGIHVIAKIENAEGVEHFDAIAQAADGIMVARGDLGVEMPLRQVPKLQKMMIRKCYLMCKPVITATQMLESMIGNPRPTRAEVSDVANAIYDSTSCVMLSGETAMGKYPIETVKMMQKIARETEDDLDYTSFYRDDRDRAHNDCASAIALSAVSTAYSIGAKAIFCFSQGGTTARILARFRPKMPIVVLSPNKKTYNRLAYHWGVYPCLSRGCATVDEAFKELSDYAQKKGIVEFGDPIVVTGGEPFGVSGTTNMMLVNSIGNILVRGTAVGTGSYQGEIIKIYSPEQIDGTMDGKIGVLSHFDNEYQSQYKRFRALVLHSQISGDPTEEEAVQFAKKERVPLLYRVDSALDILKEGAVVTVDLDNGFIN